MPSPNRPSPAWGFPGQAGPCRAVFRQARQKHRSCGPLRPGPTRLTVRFCRLKAMQPHVQGGPSCRCGPEQKLLWLASPKTGGLMAWKSSTARRNPSPGRRLSASAKSPSAFDPVHRQLLPSLLPCRPLAPLEHWSSEWPAGSAELDRTFPLRRRKKDWAWHTSPGRWESV